MAEIGKLIGRTFISLILIFSVFGFVASYSIYKNIDKDNFLQPVVDIATDPIADEFIAKAEEEGDSSTEDINKLFNEIVSQCMGRDSIVLEESEFVIDCNNIRNAGREGFEEAMRGEFRKNVESRVEQQIQGELDNASEKINLERYLMIIDIGVWAFGIFSLIMIFLLALLSNPKYKFLFDLGIVGLIAGLPFIFMINNNFLPSDNPALAEYVGSIIRSLYVNLVITFILGVAFLFVWFAWHIVLMGKNRKIKKRKPSI